MSTQVGDGRIAEDGATHADSRDASGTGDAGTQQYFTAAPPETKHAGPAAGQKRRREWTTREDDALVNGVRRFGRGDYASIYASLPEDIRAYRTHEHMRGHFKTTGAAAAGFGKSAFLKKVAAAHEEFVTAERAARAPDQSTATLGATERHDTSMRDATTGGTTAPLTDTVARTTHSAGTDTRADITLSTKITGESGDTTAGAGAGAGAETTAGQTDVEEQRVTGIAQRAPSAIEDMLRTAAVTGDLLNAGSWRGADGGRRQLRPWTATEDEALRAAIVGVAERHNDGVPKRDLYRRAAAWDKRHGGILAANGRTKDDIRRRVRVYKAAVQRAEDGVEAPSCAAARAYFTATASARVGMTRPSREKWGSKMRPWKDVRRGSRWT